MTNFEKLKAEIKMRYVVGLLIGAILSVGYIMAHFVEIPKENEIMVVKVLTVFEMGFAAFIQHIMKTPEKEKNLNNA